MEGVLASILVIQNNFYNCSAIDSNRVVTHWEVATFQPRMTQSSVLRVGKGTNEILYR